MKSEELFARAGLSGEWTFVFGIMLGQMLQRMTPEEALAAIAATLEEGGRMFKKGSVS